MVQRALGCPPPRRPTRWPQKPMPRLLLVATQSTTPTSAHLERRFLEPMLTAPALWAHLEYLDSQLPGTSNVTKDANSTNSSADVQRDVRYRKAMTRHTCATALASVTTSTPPCSMPLTTVRVTALTLWHASSRRSWSVSLPTLRAGMCASGRLTGTGSTTSGGLSAGCKAATPCNRRTRWLRPTLAGPKGLPPPCRPAPTISWMRSVAGRTLLPYATVASTGTAGDPTVQPARRFSATPPTTSRVTAPAGRGGEA